MDIELARTFLAVYETGTFNRAAERLNVTQSTVSTRIMSLEEQLGRSLFVRSRSGTELSHAGRHFHRHAANLVRIWGQARQELTLPENLSAVLRMGGQYSLWDELIQQWLPWMRKTLPGVAVHVEIAAPDAITRQLQEGLLNLAVMYMPQSRSNLVIDKLTDDRLVLVSADPQGGGPLDAAYVHVDWGPEFQAEYAMTYPGAPYPALSVSHGMLGLTHILKHGGSAYLPRRAVHGHVKSGTLFAMKGAPWFLRPIYLVHPAQQGEDTHVQAAIQGLKTIAAKMR
ncbi:MAG: LysR family transcriptional regulator [Alphaproteobacteria bacterium]|nr:LysR family transcriptional regulator [Alphaproteobacteria bacterium]